MRRSSRLSALTVFGISEAGYRVRTGDIQLGKGEGSVPAVATSCNRQKTLDREASSDPANHNGKTKRQMLRILECMREQYEFAPSFIGHPRAGILDIRNAPLLMIGWRGVAHSSQHMLKPHRSTIATLARDRNARHG